MPTHCVTSRQVLHFVPGQDEPLRHVRADWHYRKESPFAVDIDFLLSGAVVTWRFARDLLIQGMVSPAGEGDVVIHPHPLDDQRLALELSAPGGRARFELDRQAMSRFVERSLALVPLGNESGYLAPQLDRMLHSWLLGDVASEEPADKHECRHPNRAAEEKPDWLD